MYHLPILRHGREYRSMDVAQAIHFQTREPIAEVSQANVGLIRRDPVMDQQRAFDALGAFSTRQLIDVCRQAGAYYSTTLSAFLP